MKKIFLAITIFFLSLQTFAATPLPSDEAFNFSATVIDANTVRVAWSLAPGYYLYKDRIHFAVDTPNSLSMGRFSWPLAQTKTDAELGTYQIYHDQLALDVAVLGSKVGVSQLTVSYQGCSQAGFCYPPMTRLLNITIDSNYAVTNVDVHVPAQPLSQTSSINNLLTSGNWPLILIAFLSFGLLLSFTPCVLPMLPILSGIIVGHGKDITTRKAFTLSFLYVLSMSLTYAVVGIVVALLGANIQAALQNPWVITAFALLFVALACSMFGFYELQLPSSWQQKLSSISRSQHGGSYAGVFVMGVLSTLIVSPCVTPPLVGVLGFIAQHGNVALGGSALFALGMGMGAPLLIIGSAGGKLLPKAGAWMEHIKAFFGVLLLGVAIMLLSRIVSGQITLLLWAALCICVAIFLGALTPGRSIRAKFWQALGLLLLLYGAVLVVGAGLGNSDATAPLKGIASLNMARHKHPFIKVKTLADVEKQLRLNPGKPVLLDFYADWCLSCKVLDRTTLRDKQVQKQMGQFVLLRADVTKNDEDDKKLLQHYNVIAPPTFVFFNREGKFQQDLTIVGELSPIEFADRLARGIDSRDEP